MTGRYIELGFNHGSGNGRLDRAELPDDWDSMSEDEQAAHLEEEAVNFAVNCGMDYWAVVKSESETNTNPKERK